MGFLLVLSEKPGAARDGVLTQTLIVGTAKNITVVTLTTTFMKLLCEHASLGFSFLNFVETRVLHIQF